MVVHKIVNRATFYSAKMGKSDLVAMDKLFVGLNAFEPGHEHRIHVHKGQDKLYFVLKGEGDVTVGNEIARVRSGDLVTIQSGEEHALVNSGSERLVVMVVMAPPPNPKN
jgi:mannose-6-phosphate isomerase-like protein (cupin superfamily)